MPSSFCHYCGAEAHWICDYTLPQPEWKQGIPWCERAVCKEHGVSVAQEVQYCKEHAEAGIAEWNARYGATRQGISPMPGEFIQKVAEKNAG